MAEFSATDAAFTGFRIVRERPLAAAVWASLQVVMGLFIGALMVQTAGPALMAIRDNGLAPKDPAVTLGILRQLLPMYSGLLVYSLIFYPILYAAMSRVVLRPADDRFGYLRLGRDELRQLGLMLLILVLAFIFYVLSLLVLLIVVVIGVVAGGGAHAGAPPSAAAILVSLLGVAGFLCGWIYLAVRLSLASPLTFATGRVDLFGSWALTRRHFWPMFGAYLLAFTLACVVYLLGYAVILAIVAVTGGGAAGLQDMAHPDLGSMRAFLTPVRLLQTVLSSALAALILPVLLTPAAAIYQSLAAHAPGPQP